MLAQLRLRDLGVIDDAVLELSPGLNVLTGETGAGKTMVVTGLGLLLGARGDSGVVRTGASAAVVEGLLDPVAAHPARVRVAGAGGDADDEIVLVRTLSAHGRSRAHVGGRAAPVGVLAEVGELLVAVHGQADQWRLRRPEEHRALLDEFGGADVLGPRTAYEVEYARCAELTRELARIIEAERDREVELEVLRRGLTELERLAPHAGEEDALAAEDERLGHTESLRVAAATAHESLTGQDDLADLSSADGAVAAVSAARAALGAVAAHDPQLAALERRVAEIAYALDDIGGEFAAYVAGLEADPARHAVVQQRRAALGALLRRHGPTTADLLAWGETAAARVAELDGAQDRAEELHELLTQSRARLRTRADELTAARRDAADRLGAEVTAELAQLAMASARVRVLVEATQRPGPHGADTVEIALAANPGSPPRSVAKAASGGELSRVMLALEVVIAQAGRAAALAQQQGDAGEAPEATEPPAGPAWPAAAVSTFVFDEVDAGVGGRAALAIGQRLAALSRSAQVVVVTHLPQVAAFADRHLVVHKADDGHVTASGVCAVEGEERLAELARMMAGTDTPVAREHASALLADAAQRRLPAPGPTRARTRRPAGARARSRSRTSDPVT